MTLLIAVLPGYQTLGPAEIWIFIGSRLIDGIFLGGEYTSANPLAMAYSPKEERGLYGAVIRSAAPLGTAGISLVTLAVLLVFPAKGPGSPYVEWGWRIPFVVGAIMAFALAYYYKNSVEESEIWRKSDKTAHTSSPIKMLFTGENLKELFAGIRRDDGVLACAECVTAIMPGLLAVQMKMGSVETTGALVVAQLVLAAVYILGGALSLHIGRRTYALGGSRSSFIRRNYVCSRFR